MNQLNDILLKGIAGMNLAILKEYSGDVEGACRMLHELVQEHPDLHQFILLTLGDFYRKHNMPDEARKAYLHVLEYQDDESSRAQAESRLRQLV